MLCCVYRPAKSSDELIKLSTGMAVGQYTRLVLLTCRHVDQRHLVSITTVHTHTPLLHSTSNVLSTQYSLSVLTANAQVDLYQYQHQSQIYLARASFVIKNAIGGTVSDVRQKHRYMRPPYEAEA